MEALGINLGYLLVQIFNFAIVFVVLRAWVYEPILGMLEKRRAAISQGLEDARIAAEARQNAERDAQQIVAEAQSKANEVVRQGTERAELQAREIINNAEAQAAQARDAMLAEGAEERNRMLADVRGQVVDLAMAATRRLVGEALGEERQRQIITEFFSGIQSGGVAMLSETKLNGGSAEVTSALPLTESEKETVKEDVLSRLGPQSTVVFRVDPSILGGLIIRVGDKVMDASVAAKLDALHKNLR